MTLAASAPLPREFFARSPLVVAEALLNKVLVVSDEPDQTVAGRIVETEAYAGADDPGSHGYRGVTPRTEIMFGAPGHLYVYFTYGMHWCANAVADDDGACAAVLIRAVEPLVGHELITARRPKARRVVDTTNGPAKLCSALGIDGADLGLDLTEPSARVRIIDDGTPSPADPGVSTRIGLSRGAELPWRRFVAGNAWLSGPAHLNRSRD